MRRSRRSSYVRFSSSALRSTSYMRLICSMTYFERAASLLILLSNPRRLSTAYDKRRKFVDALNENNRLATEALCFIRKIYKVESDADKAGLNADERKEQRLKISYPTIRLFETWMKETYLKVLPNSKMGDAIEYTYSLLPRLSRYVNDGRINIDNNLIENAIRPLALGRKNYLFCGNDASAYRAAIVYSLISTCKAVDVDPRTWMEDVLRKIPYYQRDQRDLAELLPFNWKNRYE